MIKAFKAVELNEVLKFSEAVYVTGKQEKDGYISNYSFNNFELGITKYSYNIRLENTLYPTITEVYYVLEGKVVASDVGMNEKIELEKGDFFVVENNTEYELFAYEGAELMFLKVPTLDEEVLQERLRQEEKNKEIAKGRKILSLRNGVKDPNSLDLDKKKPETNKEKLERAKRELLQREETFRSLFERSNDAIFIVNKEKGSVITANPAALKLYGYNSFEQMMTSKVPFAPQIQPNGISTYLYYLDLIKKAEEGDLSLNEYTILNSKGEARHCLQSLSPMIYYGKDAYQEILIDVTDERLREKELENTKANLESIFNSSLDAIMVVDLESSSYVDCNPAALEMFGIKDKDELFTIEPAALSPKYQEDGRLSSEAVLENTKTVQENGYAKYDWLSCKVDGTPFYTHLSISPSIYENKDAINIVVRDTTEARIAEKKIKEAMSLIESKNEELTYEKGKSDELLLNILPIRIANDLKEKGETAPETFDEVTVLFSDIVGFTRISSKLEPKTLIDELNEIFTAFDDIMEFNDCDRIKTIGDAYLAVGGMTEKSKNHAYKIVRAATQMIEYLEMRNQTSTISWTIRVGVHSGSLVGGVVGVKKYIYDVFGDTVNTASRMETNSEEMKINISDVTYQLVKNDFTFIERETTEIKGKDLMKMWFLDPNSTV